MMQAFFGHARLPLCLQAKMAAPRMPTTQARRGPSAGGLQHFLMHFRIWVAQATCS